MAEGKDVLAPRKKAAGCCGISWRHVFKYQTWGAFVVLLAAAILTGVSHYIKEPDTRPLKLYDPTVSLPMKPDTVPMAAAAAYPFIALIITIAVIEFGVMYHKQSPTMAVQAFIHVLFMAVVGFAVVVAVAESTKPIASRFRPDYMSRCKPAGSTLADRPVKCTDTNQAELDDGRKSFPSGHSSNSLSVCWYCILYFCHALYFRQGYCYMGGLWDKAHNCWWKRLLMELLQGLFIVWGCTVVCIAWWIGVSRYTDHRHNIDDILGGFVAALLWMTPITLISLGQLNFYQQRLAAEEKAEDLSLPVTNSVTFAPSAVSGTAGTAAVGAGVGGVAESASANGGTGGTVALSSDALESFNNAQPPSVKEAWYDAKSSVYSREGAQQ